MEFVKGFIVGILFFLWVIAVSMLTGCAVNDRFGARVASGSAKYTYARTLADGSKCEVDVLSARDVAGGGVIIHPDCSVESKADRTEGVQAAMQNIGTALELLKAVAEASN